jgi:hypothetical protein
LLHEVRLDVLVGGRAVFEEIAEPIDGAALVFNKDGQLADVFHLRLFSVIFVDLLWQEIRAIALAELLCQSDLELSRTERNER